MAEMDMKMSTESHGSSPLRECPNRECKSEAVKIINVGGPGVDFPRSFGACQDCGMTGPSANGTPGIAYPLARSSWNALPRDGDKPAEASVSASRRLASAVDSVPDGDHLSLKHVDSDRLTLLIEASAFRALIDAASRGGDGDAKAGPATAKVIAELAVDLAIDRRRFGGLDTSGRLNASVDRLNAIAAIKELEVPHAG